MASDSIEVMPPLKFLAYMIVPSFISQYITIKYIEYCWLDYRHRLAMAETDPNVGICECCPGMMVKATYPPSVPNTPVDKDKRQPLAARVESEDNGVASQKMSRRGDRGDRRRSNSNASDTSHHSHMSESSTVSAKAGSGLAAPNPSSSAKATASDGSGATSTAAGRDAALGPTMSLVVCGAEAPLPASAAMSPLSPRPLSLVRPELLDERKRSQSSLSSISRVITSPVPYIMLVLLGVMIVMIFVDVMAISGLICVSAIVMVLTLTYGNHWNGTPMFSDEELGKKRTADDDEDTGKGDYAAVSGPYDDKHQVQTTHEQRVKIREEFYEEMFDSIDYNLLFIFLGLFVVIANLQATGIPKILWDAIVGDKPFATASSVIGISTFVLLASQTLGNVAVCQLAVPNIENLDDDSKRYAWAIVSFVSTIGGNLLLTGSAANLIVAEKAMRVDPTAVMNFSNHARVCFMTCIISCVVGMCTITLCNMIEMNMST